MADTLKPIYKTEGMCCPTVVRRDDGKTNHVRTWAGRIQGIVSLAPIIIASLAVAGVFPGMTLGICALGFAILALSTQFLSTGGWKNTPTLLKCAAIGMALLFGIAGGLAVAGTLSAVGLGITLFVGVGVAFLLTCCCSTARIIPMSLKVVKLLNEDLNNAIQQMGQAANQAWTERLDQGGDALFAEEVEKVQNTILTSAYETHVLPIVQRLNMQLTELVSWVHSSLVPRDTTLPVAQVKQIADWIQENSQWLTQNGVSIDLEQGSITINLDPHLRKMANLLSAQNADGTGDQMEGPVDETPDPVADPREIDARNRLVDGSAMNEGMEGDQGD